MKIRTLSALLSLAIGAGAFAQDHPKDKAATKAAAIGAPAPEFTLTDTDGKTHTLSEYTKAGNIVVLEWFNPECPYVKKHHEANKTMVETAAMFKDKKVVWLAVNSSAEGKQGYGKDYNAEAKANWKLEYPVMLDETGKVGKSYGAKTTPHMYVIAADGTLAYMGAIDNNKSAKQAGDVNYVKDAVNALLNGETVKVTTTESYGCGVKYAG